MYDRIILTEKSEEVVMEYKVLLDVAMPPEPAFEAIGHGINWIIAFVVIALVIAIVSVIIIKKGVKKAKMQEKSEATLDTPDADGDKAEE